MWKRLSVCTVQLFINCCAYNLQPVRLLWLDEGKVSDKFIDLITLKLAMSNRLLRMNWDAMPEKLYHLLHSSTR